MNVDHSLCPWVSSSATIGLSINELLELDCIREPLPPIPEETAKVARAITRRKKNVYVTFADEIGEGDVADDFADAYSKRGQPALNPVLLLLVTLIQFIENLSDRAVVKALQFRIDLKYFLHLPC